MASNKIECSDFYYPDTAYKLHAYVVVEVDDSQAPAFVAWLIDYG